MKLAHITMLAITALLLTACSYPVKGTKYPQMMQDHRLTRSINHDLLAEMKNGDVQVIQQGSRLQLVLPINKFFKFGSLKLQRIQKPTLELVSLYLHNFIGQHHTRYPVKVYAYTDEVPMYADRYEYSNEYAHVIAAFLWAHGFTPAQLRAMGYGAENPIATNRTAQGSIYNDRVVIEVN